MPETRRFLFRSALPVGIIALVCSLACRREPDLPGFNTVPDFSLTAQDGNEFRGSRLDGHVSILDWIYTTCPGPCPRLSSQMRRLQDELSQPQLRFVSLTIDPARDTPPVLAEYAQRYRAQPNRWYFLTGPQATLHDLNRNVLMLGNVDGNLEHSTRFVLVDGRRRVRGYYESNDPEQVTQLKRDAVRLLKELS